MSRTATSTPSSFQSIFDAALRDYKKKTGIDLHSHPLCARLESCPSPGSVLTVLREQIPEFDRPQSGVDNKLSNWVEPVVNVLSAYSAMMKDRDLLAYPPATEIFTGIGVLLLVTNASQSPQFDVFGRIGNIFGRLEIYIQVEATKGRMDIIVKIMIEMLSILAIATKENEQRGTKKYLKKLMGKRDIEHALQRLNILTPQDMMPSPQSLKGIQRVEYEAVEDKVAGVSDAAMAKDNAEKAAAVIANRNRNQLRHDIRKWLSPPDPSLNYQTARSTCHPGTALWFTESGAFKDWKAHGSLLWITGKPGSGKTVLSSTVIKRSSIMESAHLAYFFFDLQDSRKQDAKALLSSVLDQLSSQSDSFYDILLGLYSASDHGSHYPSNRALVQCLEDMLRAPGRVPIYLIVDALDECPNEIGVTTLREGVLEIVEKLIKLNLQNLRLCITSRPEFDIQVSLTSLSPKQICIHDQHGQRQDIADYVTFVIRSDENMRRWTKEDKKTVIETLSERANGMFRWVFCQLEILRRCHPSSILHVLAELPKTLDETYERILKTIPKTNRAHAHRLLQCLAVAVRPLRVEELAEVLAIDFDTGGKLREDWRWEDHEQAVLSACSGLISVVSIHGFRVVQFSHSSVKDFLISERLATKEAAGFYHIRLQPAHTIMAQACISVLLGLDYETDEKRLRDFPLAEYAVEHFSDHIEFDGVLPLLQSNVDYFLDPNNPHFAAWVWARRRIVSQTHPPPLEAIPLYYVAELGLHGLVEHLISKRPQDINARGGPSVTPLHAALYMGHRDVFRLLLSHPVDVDIRGNQSETPLHLASRLGYPNIVQRLLDLGADIVARDGDGWTPLHHAIWLGHSKVIRILIEHRADTQAQADDGRAPLHLSSEDGRLEAIRLSLKHNADVNTTDQNESTPLHLASQQGDLGTAALLLKHGANVHALNNKNQTPLHRTLEGQRDTLVGYLDVVHLLLEQGAQMDKQDNDGTTALHLASYTGSLAAVQLLLERGATIDVRNNNGQTPLHQTLAGSRNPSEEVSDIVRLLLEHGATVDAEDNALLTPLYLASSLGTLDAARLLLKHGANTNKQNMKGQTPLHQASEYSYLDFMRLLIEQDADVDMQDNSGSTPLHLASFRGKHAAARLLIEHGADVHARDNKGQTPLHIALGGGYLIVMELLLACGAYVNAQNKTHWTPLHLASYQGKFAAAQLLRHHGADVLMQNNKGQTALQLATARGHEDVIQLLGGDAPREQEA